MNDVTEVIGAGSNACAGIAPEDRERLHQAAIALMDARGVILSITDAVGHAVANLGGGAANVLKARFGIDFRKKIERRIERALWHLQRGASIGLGDESERTWSWFHKLVAAASGLSGGFVGAPGLAWDLPITTGFIMRSIADIARTFPGEKLTSDDTRRACIEVFAFGGPERDDDALDTAYWTTRIGLSHMAIDAFIRLAASRFGMTLSEKFLAQAVPVAGAVAGAGLNYVFIDYYQQMARVHFTIRQVERNTPDPSSVRACFSEIVRIAREQRMPRRPDPPWEKVSSGAQERA